MSEFVPYKRMSKLKNFMSLDDVLYKGKCSCIYVIRNTDNDKVYIGKTVDYKDRYHDHKHTLKKKIHVNRQLRASFSRGDNMEMFIMENCDKDVLNEREIFWIQFFKAINPLYGYNKTKGGDCGTKWTKEQKKKASNSRKGVKIDNSYHEVPVLAYSALTGEFIQEYTSLRKAGEELGVSKDDISSVCRGKVHSLKTYTFRYKKGNDPFVLKLEYTGKYKLFIRYNIKTRKEDCRYYTVAEGARSIGCSNTIFNQKFRYSDFLIYKDFIYGKFINNTIDVPLFFERKLVSIQHLLDKNSSDINTSGIGIRVLDINTSEVLAEYKKIKDIEPIYGISYRSIIGAIYLLKKKGVLQWDRLCFKGKFYMIEKIV